MLGSEKCTRDPFILAHDGRYYLYGTFVHGAGNVYEGRPRGFYASESTDLVHWSEPKPVFEPPEGFWASKHYWAPEVHRYKGRFYLFATFCAEGHMRAVQILASDSPAGPFSVWSCPVTPNDWMCLDGTLYVEDEVPYLVFCHEWVQTHDGEVCAMQLTDDLKAPAGKPRLLFRASQSAWVHENVPGFRVTDGPFLHRAQSGKLLMTWSSYGPDRIYTTGVVCSAGGGIFDRWEPCDRPIYTADGGHGMLFRGFDGRLYFTLHAPNGSGAERLRIFPVRELPDEPYLALDTAGEIH